MLAARIHTYIHTCKRLLITLCLFILIPIHTAGAGKSHTINYCWSCSCTYNGGSLNCNYEFNRTDPSCASQSNNMDAYGTLYCFEDAVKDVYCNATGCNLSCKNGTDYGCESWECTGCITNPNPGGGGGIQQCESGSDAYNSFTGTGVDQYSCEGTGATLCLNRYYDSGCCRPKTISNDCTGYNYTPKDYVFNLYSEQACHGESETTSWVQLGCAYGYSKTGTITWDIDATTYRSSVRIENCKGCSNEKCFPQTPTSCYEDGKTGCLTDNCDKNGNGTIESDEKNIPFEWINCKKLDPTSCGYSSTDLFYTDFIAKNPDDTYKRQLFYFYNDSAETCEKIWGNISCVQSGYYKDAYTCTPCPLGHYGDLDSLKYASCTLCGPGLSTFTDSNSDGKIEISEHFGGAPDSSYCKECPAGHMKTGNYCKPCENAGYYNSQTGQTSKNRNTSICTEKCPIPFTTDITDVNDSINKCYIDSGSGNTAIKLTDSLGSIFLHEEIGENVKLYHQ